MLRNGDTFHFSISVEVELLFFLFDFALLLLAGNWIRNGAVCFIFLCCVVDCRCCWLPRMFVALSSVRLVHPRFLYVSISQHHNIKFNNRAFELTFGRLLLLVVIAASYLLTVRSFGVVICASSGRGSRVTSLSNFVCASNQRPERSPFISCKQNETADMSLRQSP